MAVLRLLAGPAWPPALPALIALSFVPHFRALSSRAGCQTPSRTPSPSLLLRPGQVEVASWSSPRAPVGGAQRGRGA